MIKKFNQREELIPGELYCFNNTNPAILVFITKKKTKESDLFNTFMNVSCFFDLVKNTYYEVPEGWVQPYIKFEK